MHPCKEKEKSYSQLIQKLFSLQFKMYYMLKTSDVTDLYWYNKAITEKKKLNLYNLYFFIYCLVQNCTF